ncbi:S41 family peptidase [Undibacterium sp. Di24W]
MTFIRSTVLVSSIAIAFACTVFPSSALAQSSANTVTDRKEQTKLLQQYASQAQAALHAKDYLRAAEQYEKAYSIDPRISDISYNAACAYALAGKTDLAFAWLEKSFKAGYFNLEHIKKDSDLDALHADARWAKYLDRIQAQVKRDAKLWNSEVWKSPYAEQLSEDQRIAGLSKLWSEVKYNFIYTDILKELDWDAVYAKFLPRVKAATNTLEYYKILMEMGAMLKDGHTGVYPPDPLYATDFTVPPFRTRLIEGKVIITEVVDESLRKQGILPGVEIARINQEPVKEWAFKNTAPYASASTPQDLESRVFIYQFLIGNKADKPQIELRDAAGKTWSVEIERVSFGQRNQAFGKLPAFSWKLLPGNIAYVALNSFGDDTAAQEYMKNFAEISKAKAIIFDVRKNGGGNGSVGYKVLATLTDKDFATSRAETRDYKPSYRAWGRQETNFVFDTYSESPNPNIQFKGQVIVLTSAQTYSAAEDFTVAFDTMKRGTIMGEATGGSTGQPLMFDLPGGGSARVCTKKDSYADGKPFVGVGVQPNIVVRPKLADFRADRDTVLEAALAQIKP